MSSTRQNYKIEIAEDVVENVVEKLGKAVMGAYLAGSSNIKDDSFLSLPTDIDLHFIVDTRKLNMYYTVNTNRYGISIKIQDIPKIIRSDRSIIEILFLPKNSFNNIEYILKTHAEYAAASNLYSSELIYDPYSFLFKLRSIIVEKFPKKSYIKQRMKYALSLAYQKLDEFKLDISQNRLNLKVIWDGPLWSLMSAGNLALTSMCITPTFRKHLLYVKRILIDIELEDKYEKLLDVWGFNTLTRKDIIFFFNYMRILYKTTTTGIGYNQVIHPLKYEYRVEGIKNMISQGIVYETCFPILYTLIQNGCLIEKYNTDKRLYLASPIYDILNKMGFGGEKIESDYKLQQIREILMDFYETLVRSFSL